jgi:hypothetical protein
LTIERSRPIQIDQASLIEIQMLALSTKELRCTPLRGPEYGGAVPGRRRNGVASRALESYHTAENRMRTSICTAISAAALIIFAGTASADPWKRGNGHWRGDDGWAEPGSRKFKFRTADGCEVERKWKKGEYEEKVKCKDK